MARPSIKAAVENARRETGAPKAVEGQAGSPSTGSKQPASRVGKVIVSAYFPPEVKASLRLVQAKRGGTIADLLGEGLNMLFARYGVPEAAPVAPPKR